MKGSRELWEGAITWTLSEEDFIDARTLRDFPQNQEVFVGRNNDHSYCFDLMEKVDVVDLEESARVHWLEIAETNGVDHVDKKSLQLAKGKVDAPPPSKAGTIEVPIVYGNQKMPGKDHDVCVWIALIRLDDPYDTDVVVSWNESPASTTSIEKSLQSFQALLASIRWNDISFILA